MCHLWISLGFSSSTANAKWKLKWMRRVHKWKPEWSYLGLFAFEQLLAHNLCVSTWRNIGRFASWKYKQNRQRKKKRADSINIDRNSDETYGFWVERSFSLFNSFPRISSAEITEWNCSVNESIFISKILKLSILTFHSAKCNMQSKSGGNWWPNLPRPERQARIALEMDFVSVFQCGILRFPNEKEK